MVFSKIRGKSKKSHSADEEDADLPKQVAIAFGRNYYWALAPPGAISDGGKAQWGVNSPPWKLTKEQIKQIQKKSKHKNNNNSNAAHTNPYNCIVEQVVCTAQSSVFLTKTGKIYQQGTMHGAVWRRPVALPLPPLPFKVVQITAGRHFCLGLLEMGVGVVSWGAGHFGQLGIGNPHDLDEDDDLLSEDSEDQKAKNKNYTPDPMDPHERANSHGQLTFSSKPLIIERLLPHNNVEGSPVVEVAAGDWHALALTASGRIWAWGNNRNFQCGRDPESCCDSNNRALPVLIDLPEPVPKFNRQQSGSSSGSDDDDDSENNKNNNNNNSVVHSEGTISIPTPTIMSPIPVPLPVKVKHIAAGRAHSAAIAANGKQVYCWGNSHHGQCGNYTTHRTVPGLKPAPVEALDGLNLEITQLAAAGNHTLALTQQGRVMAWGSHSEGELGIGGGKLLCVSQGQPRIVSELDFVSASTSTTTDKPQESSDTQPPPESQPAKKEVKEVPHIVSIHAGASYSAVVSSSGHVYVWGTNDAGQLGLDTPEYEEDLPFRDNLPVSPLDDEGSKDIKYDDPTEQLSGDAQATAGSSTLRDLHVHTFDSRHNVVLPVRLDAVRSINVEQIACGPNHMWCLGEPRSLDDDSSSKYGYGRTLIEVQQEEYRGKQPRRRSQEFRRTRMVRKEDPALGKSCSEQSSGSFSDDDRIASPAVTRKKMNSAGYVPKTYSNHSPKGGFMRRFSQRLIRRGSATGGGKQFEGDSLLDKKPNGSNRA